MECREAAAEDELWMGWYEDGWTHQQGHKVGKGLRRGGTRIAVKEDWRAEMHKVRTDSREWGRYAIRELKGRSCASMAIVSLYLPTGLDKKESGGGAWDWQTQQMLNLRRRLEKHREAGTLDKQNRAVFGPSGATGYTGGWRERSSCESSEPSSVRPGTWPGQGVGRVRGGGG